MVVPYFLIGLILFQLWLGRLVVECRTRDRQVVWVPVSLSVLPSTALLPSGIIWNGDLCVWEGNRKAGDALASYHRLKGQWHWNKHRDYMVPRTFSPLLPLFFQWRPNEEFQRRSAQITTVDKQQIGTTSRWRRAGNRMSWRGERLRGRRRRRSYE